MKKTFLWLLALIGVHEQLSAQQKQDLVGVAAQTTPGAVASGVSSSWGLTSAEILTWASVILVVLQIAFTVWRWRREARNDRLRALHGLPPASKPDAG